MQVRECMSKDVKVLNESESLQKAAKLMKENDIGSIPVEKDDKLIGMITDRDIVMAIAENSSAIDQLQVGKCMNSGIKYCFEDEELRDVENQMQSLDVRRMPVMNRDKRLVGIVSLKDLSQASHA